jgi:hypothetical protein
MQRPNIRPRLERDHSCNISQIFQVVQRKRDWSPRHVSLASERVLGKEHPDTLTSMSNLASVLKDQGKDEQAEEADKHV